MGTGTPISQLEKAQNVPSGTTFIAEMGDGSGTKAVTRETMAKGIGEELKIGNTENLQTDNKGSLVEAINEAAKSGGGGSSVDILDSKEEIEANTESNKVAGAQALKEMFGEVNNNFKSLNDNGNIKGMDVREDGVYITYVPADGADAVTKKLGSSDASSLNVLSKTATLTFNNSSGSKTATISLISGLTLYKNLFPVITKTTLASADSGAYNYIHTFSFSYNNATGVLTVSRHSNGNMSGNSTATITVYYLSLDN